MHEIETYGPIKALHHGNRLFGVMNPWMTVRCYAVDGLLIDSGLATQARHVVHFAKTQRIGRIALTHHHEDHSGNAGAFAKARLPLFASEKCVALVRDGFHMPLYQRIAWGRRTAATATVFSSTIETEKHAFQIVPAPGHCDDQVVLHEPNQGWLFSGDLFLAERVKYFRGDEDFAQTISSLKHIASLDFDMLLCSHRPVAEGGQKALHRKLAYLLEIEERVRVLAAKGIPLSEITRQVLGNEPRLLNLVTNGDLSKRNLVRSILHGPVPRKR